MKDDINNPPSCHVSLLSNMSQLLVQVMHLLSLIPIRIVLAYLQVAAELLEDIPLYKFDEYFVTVLFIF